MKNHRTFTGIFKNIIALAALGAFCACAGPRPSIKPVSPDDTPQNSYKQGLNALEAGRADDALTLFQRSVGLDPNYQPGYIGQSLAYAAKRKYTAAAVNVEKALSLNDNPAAHVAYGRVYLAQAKYRQAMEELDQALEKDDKYADAYYWKGQVYEAEKNSKSAVKMYKKALEADRDHQLANAAWEKIQDTERAQTGLPKQYLKISASVAVTRGEIAALLVEELGVEKYLEPVAAAPVQASTDPFPAPYNPVKMTDLAGSWAAKYAEIVVRYGVMEKYPDQSFQPERPVAKGELALLLQGVLLKAKAADISATMFLDSLSPFSDVGNTHFAFNAVMLSSTRGFLPGKTDGTFGMTDKVTGSDAILAFKKLKGVLEKARE